MGLKEVAACLKNNNSFLITAHTNPEGDALGAELGFCNLVRKMGKSAVIINEDSLPYGYEFLPAAGSIKKYNDRMKGLEFDCFVALDCSDLSRCKDVYKLNAAKKPVLNIDHHISNSNFGDINWVDPYATSCSEMIFRLYKKLGLALDRDSALSLYVGIFTDTGSFRYSNTTALTHKIVSELLRFGFDIPQIYKSIYGNIPYQDMQLLTRILPSMRQEAQGRLVWFQIKKDLLRNKKIYFDLTENILTLGRAIKDVEVAVLFKENLGIKNEIRVNLRSQGKVDVNKIASFFGGGGHKTASGITMHGKIDSVRKMVLAKIKESL